MGARFELLDGDAEILPGLSVVATPGHTVGHQCVAATGDGSLDLLIGDAAYTPREYAGPLDQKLPPGQAADRPSWETSIGRVRSMTPSRVHFCHHTDVVHD
jgi:N-acyl homoserine lactone hydrolase